MPREFGGFCDHIHIQPGLIPRRGEMRGDLGRHISRGARRIGATAQPADRSVEDPHPTREAGIDILQGPPRRVVVMPGQPIRWHLVQHRRQHRVDGFRPPRPIVSPRLTS